MRVKAQVTVPTAEQVRAVLRTVPGQRVLHTHDMPALNDELLVFPHGLNDEPVNTVTTDVEVLLQPKTKKRTAAGCNVDCDA